MKTRHIPEINARYWTAITLASVFGTNMGDFYAHESGLGLLGGLPILLVIFVAAYALERRDRSFHEAYYWLCIIILRTGATNIADYLAGHTGLDMDRSILSFALGLSLAALVWWGGRGRTERKGLPDTGTRYWTAMLLAGVLGTVLGDLCEHVFGEGVAAAGLGVVLGVALLIYGRGRLRQPHAYWLTIATARTAGTAIGDYFAESSPLNLGLSVGTLLSGAAFVAVLVFWRSRHPRLAEE